jgi:threonine aldolase
MEMREAMMNAKVGDDVYGEDPTVNELEKLAAEKLGKASALFVASGTMGNLAAVLSHAGRGELAIVGADGHIFSSEAGGMAALGGVIPHPLPTDYEGKMNLADIKASLMPEDPHYARARLILLENTYGAKSGAPQPISYLAAIRALAEQHRLRIHLDGARLFNAAAALEVDVGQIARHVDSVSFCLSKGLCAPVGSLLCGSEEFIGEARRMRKILGGAMRQAGIIAAAGIIALQKMTDRLPEDHANAKSLAMGLAKLPGIHINSEAVKTNIIFFELDRDDNMTAQYVADRLKNEFNILVGAAGDRRFRALTHYGVGPSEIQQLIEALEYVLDARE